MQISKSDHRKTGKYLYLNYLYKSHDCERTKHWLVQSMQSLQHRNFIVCKPCGFFLSLLMPYSCWNFMMNKKQIKPRFIALGKLKHVIEYLKNHQGHQG